MFTPRQAMKPHHSTRSFCYRAGVRIPGTEITCDGAGLASDLIFLSHADALPARAHAALRGRRQLVTTLATLRLLGPAGTRLRARSLPAVFGQPFDLGAHRLEVVPSGHLPGSAALLCKSGTRRVLYLGAFCPEPLFAGVEPACLRRADALCVDASLAAPDLHLPPRQQSLAELRSFTAACLDERGALVLLASPFGALPAVVLTLARDGIAMRAERSMADVLGRMRPLLPGLPVISRFAGKARDGEVLLWPRQARNAGALARLGDLPVALVAGSTAPSCRIAGVGLARGFALSNLPSFAEIVAAVLATGAREIALTGGAAEPAAAMLRARGLDAYALGPPHQMSLPSGGPDRDGRP
jgi:hypothetical protein